MRDVVFQNIDIDLEAIAAFCRKHHIQKLALFGSVLRDDFRPDSDVDVLVTFEPDHTPGFIRLSSMERELSGILNGREVDFVTKEFLHPLIRKQVLPYTVTLYEE